MEWTVLQVKHWLSDLSRIMQEKKEELSRYDQAIGDGDHGVNMARGFKEVEKVLAQEHDPHDIGWWFQTVSRILLSKVGGASGPLYGTVFLKMASVCKGKSVLTHEEWVTAFSEARQGLKMRGKAEPGDKTMLDVWEPVVRYMEQAKEQISWQMVKDIAEQSMIDTRAMVAKKGRASYLGERSRGHLDPGAVSSYYFFRTWADQPWKEDRQ